MSWLATMPAWFNMVFLILFGIVLTLLIVVIGKNGMGIVLKRGKNEFIIGKQPQSNEQTPYSPHRNCPHNRDIYLLIHETHKLIGQKFHLQTIDVVRQQMNYTEQRTDQLRGLLQKVYLQELEKKGTDRLVKSMSYLAYTSIIKEIQSAMLAKFRYSFRENHFDEMNEAEFSTFIVDKFEFMVAEVSELLNTLYFYEEDITREELYDLHMLSISKYKEILSDIYHAARRIAVDMKVKLMELEEAADTLLSRYI